MTKVDLADVQGNILRAYKLPVARYLFFRVDHRRRACKTLLLLADEITSASPWSKSALSGRTLKPPSTLNLGLNFQGLIALGLPCETLSGFSPAFQAGMSHRANLLGDCDESGIAYWDKVWQTNEVHVWISVNAASRDELRTRCRKITQLIKTKGGFELLAQQRAAALGQRKEHFGYTDGIGNPDVEGSQQPQGTRTGKLTAAGQWAPLATGEFLLGHVDEGQEIPPLPLPNAFSRNGTFMVYRKLYQKVALFRRFLRDQGRKYEGGVELFAAKLVGRWRDGTPLALSPDCPDTEKILNNRFTYEDDPDGLNCPIGAHIRRANPRASLGFEGKLANRHRIIRRGLPYGTPLPDDVMDDDGKDRGIIFMAINANIERQFEFVQRQWMNYGNKFGLGNDKDPLIGDHDGQGKFLIQADAAKPPGHAPHICQGLERFVLTRGGDYFFLPSISGLRMLARGEVKVS